MSRWSGIEMSEDEYRKIQYELNFDDRLIEDKDESEQEEENESK